MNALPTEPDWLESFNHHFPKQESISVNKHPDQRAAYVLRKADIQEMVNDGTIGQRHFLIRLLAEGYSADEEARKAVEAGTDRQQVARPRRGEGA